MGGWLIKNATSSSTSRIMEQAISASVPKSVCFYWMNRNLVQHLLLTQKKSDSGTEASNEEKFLVVELVGIVECMEETAFCLSQ
jgi:hypothetical protein